MSSSLMPTPQYIEFPIAITIIAYVAGISLVLIVLMLFRLSGQLSALSLRLTKTSRTAKLADPDASPNIVEAGPGTPFEEFLREDSQRFSLTKKEQFKAYRAWRAEKGLNWDK